MAWIMEGSGAHPAPYLMAPEAPPQGGNGWVIQSTTPHKVKDKQTYTAIPLHAFHNFCDVIAHNTTGHCF